MDTCSSTNTELAEAAENAAKGFRDVEAMEKASARLDAAREETRKRVGTVEVAVDLVREARE